MFTVDNYLEAKARGDRHAGSVSSVKTDSTYRQMLKRAEALVGCSLAEFTEESADVLMKQMQAENFSANTRALMLSALRGAFDWAIGTRQYALPHPFLGIVIPKPNRVLPTVFTDEQLEDVFNSIPNEKYRLFFSLMYYAGLRFNEARTLRKDALRQNGSSYALLIRGKGSVERLVPLPTSIAHELVTFMDEHPFGEYVFYNEQYDAAWDKPVSNAYAYELFRDIKKRLGLPDNVRPHSFRSTSATKIHRATGDLAQTQRFLGHARPETTMIYVQITDDQLQKASETAFGPR